jgi:hypothetical protein
MAKKSKSGVEVGDELQKATPQAAQAGAQPRKRKGRGKVVDGASAAPGRTGKTHPKQKRAPGKVVSIGVDVPKLDELKAEEAAREQFERQAATMGRPTDYHPRFAEIARAMCKLGASDFDLAQEFGVMTSTIWLWRCKFEEFSNSTLEGKEAFDNRIERSLAQRAAGYSVHTEKVFQYEGTIARAETVEHYPPDVSACRLWLMNRRPDKWRDKSEVKLDSDGAFLKLWQAISDGTAGDRHSSS